MRTKIVCTIGPATSSVEQIKALHSAGMSVARINCSHGDPLQYRQVIKNIREASKEIAIMFDTQGPEIRIGDVKPGTVLNQNDIFKFSIKPVDGDSKKVFVSYPGLVSDVKKGDSLFIDSGFLELKVIGKNSSEITCKVVTGGKLGSHKGVNHPGAISKMPSFTKKDKEDLRFGLAHGIDLVAASFVRSADDVKEIKSFLRDYPHVKVFAKIENLSAVQNVQSIIEAADGVMVARGDLGVELPQEKVPVIQKDIITRCNMLGKPVITATQMLESMVSNPRPTRAEASDVANAILDGSDAIMLSEETAIGKYPAKAVAVMTSIGNSVEQLIKNKMTFCTNSTDDAVANAACRIIEETGLKNIVVCTHSGHSARLISKYRPQAGIIAVTPHEAIMRSLSINWGVEPLLLHDHVKSTRDLIFHSIKAAVESGLLSKSEDVVIIAASPFDKHGITNLIEVRKASDVINRGPG